MVNAIDGRGNDEYDWPKEEQRMRLIEQLDTKHQHQQSMSQQVPAVAIGIASSSSSSNRRYSKHRQSVMLQEALGTSNRRCHMQQGSTRSGSKVGLGFTQRDWKGKWVAESIYTLVRDENISFSNLETKAELNSVKLADSTNFTKFTESTRDLMQFYQISILLPSWLVLYFQTRKLVKSCELTRDFNNNAPDTRPKEQSSERLPWNGPPISREHQ